VLHTIKLALIGSIHVLLLLLYFEVPFRARDYGQNIEIIFLSCFSTSIEKPDRTLSSYLLCRLILNVDWIILLVFNLVSVLFNIRSVVFGVFMYF